MRMRLLPFYLWTCQFSSFWRLFQAAWVPMKALAAGANQSLRALANLFSGWRQYCYTLQQQCPKINFAD